MRHANLFHTGIVVDDLAAAKEQLGDLLGVTWFEGGGAVRVITDNGACTVRATHALSQEGPHHVELAQSADGTRWTATAPGRARSWQTPAPHRGRASATWLSTYLYSRARA